MASVVRDGIRDPYGPDFENKLEMLLLLSRRSNRSPFHAEKLGKRSGAGVEFAEYRDYVSGDDFRCVDPYAAMRFDRLLLRLYEEEEDQSVYLLVDTSRSMGQHAERKLDHAKRLAAALAYIGLAALNRVTVLTTSERPRLEYPTTRGRGQFPSILRFLRGIEASGATRLDGSLRHFARQHRRRGLVVLLSDLYDPEGFERGLDAVRSEGFEVQVLHLVDDRDLEPALHGDAVIVDCESGHEQSVTITEGLKRQLRVARENLVCAASQHCRGRGFGYATCDVANPFDQAIRHFILQPGRFAR